MYRQWFLLLNHFLVVACVSLNRRIDSDVYRHIELLKTRMLAELGLSSVPSLTHVNTTAEEMQRMIDIYYQKLKEDELEEQRITHMSILEYVSLKSTGDRSEDPGQRTFFFILPSIPPDIKSLYSATLRLSNYPNSTGLLKVFQASSSGDHLVSEAPISGSNEWELFDVSRVVRQWIKDPSSNEGLRVECRRCEGILSNHVTLELLVRNRGHRIRRSTDRIQKKRKHGNPDCVGGANKGCCRRSFQISFKEVGWTWILKPETVDIHLCRGKCVEGGSMLSNHAMIKRILWKKRGGKKSFRLCCVARKTKDLRVLYYDQNKPPLLKTDKLRKVIVKRCGCA